MNNGAIRLAKTLNSIQRYFFYQMLTLLVATDFERFVAYCNELHGKVEASGVVGQELRDKLSQQEKLMGLLSDVNGPVEILKRTCAARPKVDCPCCRRK